MTNPSQSPEIASFASMLRRLVAACEQGVHWRVDASDEHWIHAGTRHASLPAQGWKLHVSASVFSAAEVLRRCVPILLEENLFFKIAATPRQLAMLNSGRGGPTQVGKFMAIYPPDDQSAVRVAHRLEQATRGLKAPRVPSSRPLRPDSIVHYRFGGFGGRFLQTPAGEITGALQAPDGSFVPDRRGAPPPAWANDPFAAMGVLPAANQAATSTESSEPRCIAGRFVITGRLDTSPRGALWIALDLETKTKCVLKEARRGAMSGPDGHDAQSRLRREAQVLSTLEDVPSFPSLLGLVEDEGVLYLAMEDIEGRTLTQKVLQLHRSGQGISNAQIADWTRQLAEALRALHERNLVYRDLKSANVLVSADHKLRLIDLETAHAPGEKSVMSEFGTPGYISPQQRAGGPPAFADDIYALGAILYFVATGAEPSAFPATNDLLSRAPRLCKPDFDPRLEAILARCLAPELENRFATVEDILRALDKIGSTFVSSPAVPGLPQGDISRFCETAWRLWNSMADAIVPAPAREDGQTWRSTHDGGQGFLSRDLNIGSAGSLLAFAELTGEFKDADEYAKHRNILQSTALHLKNYPRASQLCGAPLPGLYVGLAGTGAALLRAGQVLEDADFVDAASALSREIADLPHISPDLFNGTAGRLKFHLWLWDATRDERDLEAARVCGDVLLENAVHERDETRWLIPPGYGTMSGNASVGYSHGAAGIADALLDLWEVTRNEKYLKPVCGAANWLQRLAVVAPDGQALNWPTEEGKQMAPPFWCHGATGIGWFFLRAAQLDVVPAAREYSQRAGLSAASSARWSSPTFCHGLAGNIGFLLDIYQWTRDDKWRDQAMELGALLSAWAIERNGMQVFPSEQPHVISPDYMVGYAGVALCFLRLADPENRPHQLSCAGFRFK